MSSFCWLTELQRVFGQHRVEDALEGTELQRLGWRHNFGLYVVRGAMTQEDAKRLMAQSKCDIAEIARTSPSLHRAVALQGNTKKKAL